RESPHEGGEERPLRRACRSLRDNAVMATDAPVTAGPDAGAIALSVPVEAHGAVPALLLRPPSARACYVFAHGAGAGMRHGFMAAFAAGLAARHIATLRFDFPFMARGSRRPDPPSLAHATVRGAVRTAAEHCAGLPLFAGGKSFGGRMTSQAQALAPLPGVLGLVFVGFPLHPAGKPSTDRGAHLSEIDIPMLFLQGTRDSLAEIGLIEPAVSRLPSATLHLVD